MRSHDPAFMLRLLSGLSGYDESQYREWLITHPEAQTDTGGRPDNRLSYHSYTQDTMLLNDLRNMMAAFTNSRNMDEDGKPLGPRIDMILPPGAKEDKPVQATGFKQLQAMVTGMSLHG